MIIKGIKSMRCKTTKDAARLFQKALNSEDVIDREKEHFWILHLSNRLKVKYLELVSLGTLEATATHPREVYRRAVISGTSQIIVSHNHTSDEIEPSDDDVFITKRLQRAGDILGIELIDHIIIGTGTKKFISFKGRGLIRQIVNRKKRLKELLGSTSGRQTILKTKA